ncbi:MAG: hypothetical protein AAGI68_14065 [Planctomycetota bacterium]
MSDDAEQPEKRKPGPEAERLKLDLDWEDAARQMMAKEKPPEGWPDPSTKPKDDEAPDD